MSHIQPNPQVAICPAGDDASVRTRAERLAAELQLPLALAKNFEYELLLNITPERVELRTSRGGGPGPIYVDFVGGPLGYSRRVGGSRLLYKAVGIGPGKPMPRVIDATAGLGRDAFLLAYRGCSVTAVERSPVLMALLRDGIERAMQVPDILERIAERLNILSGDARDILRQMPDKQRPDVVYLDPMFPPKTKSALVKKEMRVLRSLVGDDSDAGELFESARQVARRVVVKRLRLAPPLGPKPTRSYIGQSTRYDVYE